jgi:hypothetical protein
MASNPQPISQAHISHQTTEFVVETGAFKKVARFIQIALQTNVDIITEIAILSSKTEVSTIFVFIVSTTSHQAIIAHSASAITAIIKAFVIVKALDQTAGHILFATSFAHKFIAMYAAKTVARSK